MDADPWSWAHNAQSGHAGIATVRGRPWADPPERAAEQAIDRDPRGALPLLDARIAAHPDDADAYRLRARAYGRLAAQESTGEHATRQRADLDRVVDLHPADPDALAARAWVRLLRGDQRGACDDYAAAARRDPENPVRHRDHGFALMGTGQQRASADAYGRALALASADPSSLIARGSLLETLGEMDAAVEGYRYVLAIVPTAPWRDSALARLAELGRSPEPGMRPPSDLPAVGPPSVTPGPGGEVARGTIGPAGGRIEGEGVRLDFPPEAVAQAVEVVVHRDAKGVGATTLVRIDVARGRTTLGVPIRVTLTMDKDLDPATVRPALQVGERLWVQLPGTYDAASGALSLETPHFSTLGGLVEDTGNLKWLLGTGLVAVAVVGGGWCIAGSWGAMYAAATAMTTLETLVVGASTFFFGKLVGDAAYDTSRATLYGLDKVLAVPGFQILYAGNPKGPHAVPGDDWGTAVFDKATGAHACLVRGRVGPDHFQNGALYDYVHVPNGVVSLAFELMLARNYYDKAGYRVRPVTTVFVHAMGPGAQGTTYGSWESAADERLGGVLNVNAAYLGAAHDLPRRAMVAHESWHGIAKANGLADAHAPWIDEAVAWALEGTVFEGTTSFLTERGWAMTQPELLRGLVLEDDEDPVKRGTFLWPFARYLLHRDGHSEVRELVSGRLGTAQKGRLRGHFLTFARSLLTTEHQLDDWYPQNPPVVMRDGKPIEIASGWQPATDTRPGLNHASLSARLVRPGIVQAGSSLAAPRPLSFALFTGLVKDPPPPADGERPPLVLRRKMPSEAEAYAVLRPIPNRRPGEGRPRPPGDVRIESRVVVAPGSWFESPDPNGDVLPLAVVGVDPEERGPPSPLLLYWLDAPHFDRVEPLPDNPLWTRLHFQAPAPGGKGSTALRPSDCYEQIQLLGFDEDGKAHVLATAPEQFVLDAPGGKGHVDISNVGTGSYQELGFVALDKEATGDDGEPLRSPVRRFDNPAVADAVYPVVGIMGELAFRCRVTGTLKESGKVEDSAWKLEHGLEQTTWDGRRHVETWVDGPFHCAWMIRMALGDESIAALNLTLSRDEPDSKGLQAFRFEKLPQIHVADLGPEGPVLRFYGLKGEALVKQAVAYRCDGSGAYEEFDEETNKPKRVTFSTSFESWNGPGSWLLLTVVSMTWEDLKRKVESGALEESTFQGQFYGAMEAARAALEATAHR